MLQKNDITIMNFSHVYEAQNFYKGKEVNWLDCTDLAGTNCYCDKSAGEELRKRLTPFSYQGIHFLDSGNYHYMSKFWTEKIKEPFVLMVFDYHSDMQKPAWGNILSCGSWILEVLAENTNLQKVMIIGLGKEQEEQIPLLYKEKIICMNAEKITGIEQKGEKFTDSVQWKDLKKCTEQYPVYLSIDKDVLDYQETVTNWDQGNMTMVLLEKMLKSIVQDKKILGVDICGEMDYEPNDIMEMEKSSSVNEKFLNLFEKERVNHSKK